MGESKVWTWIKTNAVTIMVPIISFGGALVISYGTSVQEETLLLNRVDTLEVKMANIEREHKELEDELDDYKDDVSLTFDRFKDAYKDGDEDIEDMIVTEGRDLERQLLRIQGRVDAIGRRVAFIDGIGAPSGAPESGYGPILPPPYGEEVE